MSDPQAFRLIDTFAHLGYDGSSATLPVDDDFWPRLTSGGFDLPRGCLLSFYEFSEDWDSWEIHPKGDEFVCLFSGEVDFVLDLPGGHHTIEMREPASFLVVPRGTWHTARVLAPSRALFVTPGEGTEHRPL